MNDEIVRHIKNYKLVFLTFVLPFLYFLGYLEYTFFLQLLNITLIPTVIFSKIDILMSGIYTFILCIMYPVIVYLIHKIFRQKFDRFIIVLFFGYLYFYYLLMHGHFSWDFIGEAYKSVELYHFNKYVIIIFAFLILFLIPVELCLMEHNKKHIKAIFTITLLAWSLAVSVLSITECFPVLYGAPPNYYRITQNGDIGYIYTNSKLCNISEENDDGTYKTSGAILNVNNGIYYFHPGILASIDAPDTSLCIINANEVLLYKSAH